MKIEVKTEDAEGNILFQGTLNKLEVQTVLEVGINFLLANGIMPLFSGKENNEAASLVVPETTTKQ